MSETPQVLREAYQFLSLLIDKIIIFPKKFKYTLGSKLEEKGIDMIASMSFATKAYLHKEKQQYLQKAKENLEVIQILLFLSYEKLCISKEEYSRLHTLKNNLEQQLSKRLHYCLSQNINP